MSSARRSTARYRKLALVLHPDTPTGDTALMQQLNIEFEAFEAGQLLPVGPSDRAWAPPPTYDRAERLRAAAQTVIQDLPALSGVRFVFDSTAERVVALGTTFPVKDVLRSLGMRWDADRRHWWIEVIG